MPIISPLLLGCFPAIVGVTKRYPTPLAALAFRFKASRALRSFTSAIGFRQIRHRLGPRVIRRLIWIDMGWYGLIRSDLEWNGLIWVLIWIENDWYGLIRSDVECSVMGWYGLIRIVMEWFGVKWVDMSWYGLVRSDLEWNGLIWVDMDWYGVIWSEMGWYGLIRIVMEWFGVKWVDMSWYGLIRTDMEWYELIWLIWVGTDWCGRIWSEMGWYGLIEESFEITSQTSDNMDRWKAEMGRVREEKRREEASSKRESLGRKKIQVREKVRKSRNTVFFQWLVAPEGRKVGSLKRRVRSQLATCEMKNCTPLWREAHSQVKMYKAQQVRTTFGSFWCRKSARRCGAKHISKSKVQKSEGSGAFLDVQMSFCVAGARDCAPCQKRAKREGFVAFSTTTTTTTLHYTTLPSTTLQLHLHYIPLHYTTLHSTALHSITLHYTRLRYTTLRYTTLHYATLRYTTLHYTTLHSLQRQLQLQLHLQLHYATLRYILHKFHYTTLNDTTLLLHLHLQLPLQLQFQLHYITLYYAI